MKITFVTPTMGTLKATVQQTGKLGFSSDAAKELGLSESSYIKIGINEDDTNDTNLYLVILSEPDENAFKVYKAGEYFYLNTKQFFLDHGIDYTKKKIIYGIGKFSYDDVDMYKLIRRVEKDRE